MKQDHIQLLDNAALSLTRSDVRGALIGCIGSLVSTIAAIWLESWYPMIVVVIALLLVTANLALAYHRLTRRMKGEPDDSLFPEVFRQSMRR